jgi:hypothetical protein
MMLFLILTLRNMKNETMMVALKNSLFTQNMVVPLLQRLHQNVEFLIICGVINIFCVTPFLSMSEIENWEEFVSKS